MAFACCEPGHRGGRTLVRKDFVSAIRAVIEVSHSLTKTHPHRVPFVSENPFRLAAAEKAVKEPAAP